MTLFMHRRDGSEDHHKRQHNLHTLKRGIISIMDPHPNEKVNEDLTTYICTPLCVVIVVEPSNSTILTIQSVSWSGHSFVGLTETDQLVTYICA